ncbi:MAG: CopG family transcriptional regulator [Acidobacteriota bacterium]
MKNTPDKKNPPTAEQIALMAERGEDISRFFTNQGEMKQPPRRVNVDFTPAMLAELDEAAQQMNISRQAVIKAFVRQGLDQRYLAQQARKAV